MRGVLISVESWQGCEGITVPGFFADGTIGVKSLWSNKGNNAVLAVMGVTLVCWDPGKKMQK